MRQTALLAVAVAAIIAFSGSHAGAYERDPNAAAWKAGDDWFTEIIFTKDDRYPAKLCDRLLSDGALHNSITDNKKCINMLLELNEGLDFKSMPPNLALTIRIPDVAVVMANAEAETEEKKEDHIAELEAENQQLRTFLHSRDQSIQSLETELRHAREEIDRLHAKELQDISAEKEPLYVLSRSIGETLGKLAIIVVGIAAALWALLHLIRELHHWKGKRRSQDVQEQTREEPSEDWKDRVDPELARLRSRAAAE